MKNRGLSLFLAFLLAGSLASPASSQSLGFKDNSQTPVWTQPLNAPFVDIFHLLPDNRLLVGALGWNADSGQFRQGDLRLLSAIDGSTVWTAKRDPIPGAIYSVVEMQHGIIVLQAATIKETRLFAYAQADGQRRWSRTFKGVALSSPVAETTTLVVTTGEHVLGLDVLNGEPSWTRPVELRGSQTVPGLLITSDSICIMARHLACLDRETGKERWNSPDPDTSPLGRGFLVDSKLITATDTGITAWNIANGAQLWRIPAPFQGLADISADDTTLYGEWLDSGNLTVTIQSISVADGKTKWTSEPGPIPRSALTILGDSGYFSSPSSLTKINLRTGKVTARVPLPLRLIDTDRKPDDIVVSKDAITLLGANGAATFSPVGLELQKIAAMQVGGTWVEAKRNLQEQTDVLAKDSTEARGAPISLHLGQSSALANAAQTRIQLAYAYARPVVESPRSTHAQKAAAHAYVAQEIGGAISMQRTAIQLQQMEATLDLDSAIMEVLSAPEKAKRRDNQAKLALFRYFALAGDLRNEGTPPGYLLAGGANRIEVFDSSRNAIADVHHSNESEFGWVHIALLSEDGRHLIGAHVGHVSGRYTTQITSEVKRPNLDIERYELAQATWRVAEPPAADDELIVGIRTGKTTSLLGRDGTCYAGSFKPLHGRIPELVLAAIAGHNIGLLKEMRINGAFNLARPVWSFDAIVVARDTLDRELTAVLEDAAAHEKADLALAKAVRLDDREKAKAAADAGGNPDGFAPLNEMQTCNTPLLWFAKSDAMRSLLLERGAHVNIAAEKGQTPLDIALAQKNSVLERFLRAHGGKTAAQLP
jgi:outer membrane protein assembly factor BamB